MSKQKSPKRKPRGSDRTRPIVVDSLPAKAAAAQTPKSHIPSSAAVRETIESLVIAFVLAFLFRTFEAEAFVIPTGSMAPTLMGRHKDLECSQCGYPYRVSASREVNQTTGKREPGVQVSDSTCPMCRYTMDLGIGRAALKKNPSFKGDRILVGKFAYQFADPQRWDVAVFKYPEAAKTNFIKRLVGLPNELLRISHGDIFTSPIPGDNQDSQWAIARKPPEKLLAMLQPVFDNNLTPRLAEYGWLPRWRTAPGGAVNAAESWTTEDGASFATDGLGSGWLRYEHRVPSPEEWESALLAIERGAAVQLDPAPQLISDFCAYNTDRGGHSYDNGLHWVGDLAVACNLNVQSSSGQVILELVEGGWRMQCRIDVSNGAATLTILPPEDGRTNYPPAETDEDEPRPYGPKAETSVKGPGEYEVLFANCDDQLRLWVDGELVIFDTTTRYAPLENWLPRQTATADDLAPAGIASEGVKLRVSDLAILRDIYYIAIDHTAMNGPSMYQDRVMKDFRRQLPMGYLSNPEVWREAFQERNFRHVDFRLEADQFLALGDNSAQSKDGRLWESQRFVDRNLLIGKALYIYWPHSWDKLPGTRIPFPFFPNFSRMGFVR